MDEHHFDDLTRSLGSGLSRRRTLRAALGGLLAAVAGATALSPVDAKSGKGHGKRQSAHKHMSKSQGKNKHRGKSQQRVQAQCGDGNCEDPEESTALQCNQCSTSGAPKVGCAGHTCTLGSNTCCVTQSLICGNGHCCYKDGTYEPADPTKCCSPYKPESKTCGPPSVCIAKGGTGCVAGSSDPAKQCCDPNTVTCDAAGKCVAKTCSSSCTGKTCGQKNECGDLCGGCQTKEFCVLTDNGQSASCKAVPSDCVGNGERGICCSGYHRDGVCCDANDPGAVAITVTTNVFNQITINTPPTTVITTVNVPAAPAAPATIITTPSVGGAGRRKKRRKHHRRRKH